MNRIPAAGQTAISDSALSSVNRRLIVWAVLLALFLGAMDALIMSAAMPTIVAELGGLQLYSWAYSSYMLARAVSLPIFGKLADRFDTKRLFITAIGIFVTFSALAGFSGNMSFLIATRAFQGIGAGGNFALVYIVLAEIAPKGKRGLYLSWASFVWGLASVLGPSLGGLVITYLSWPWIFFINIPLGLLAALGIIRFYSESRIKQKQQRIDVLGTATLTLMVLAILFIFMLGGRAYAWISWEIGALAALTLLLLYLFIVSEKKASDPILALPFFGNRAFRNGNGAVFFSAFAIFALFAYVPLFIQGALGLSPLDVGMSMLVLSAGWSLGSLAVGFYMERIGRRRSAVIGAVLLLAGCAGCLTFSPQTTLPTVYAWLVLVGMGMGVVGVATMVKVQNALDVSDLGIATSSNQFARSLGGTIGVGICGGVVTNRITETLSGLNLSGQLANLPREQLQLVRGNIESLFDPLVMNQFAAPFRRLLHQAVAGGLDQAFMIIAAAALLCCILCLRLPADRNR